MARKKSIKAFPDSKPVWVVTRVPYGTVRDLAASGKIVYEVDDPKDVAELKRIYGISTRSARYKWFDYTTLLVALDDHGEIREIFGVRVPEGGGGAFDGDVDRIVWGWTDPVRAKAIESGEMAAGQAADALCFPS